MAATARAATNRPQRLGVGPSRRLLPSRCSLNFSAGVDDCLMPSDSCCVLTRLHVCYLMVGMKWHVTSSEEHHENFKYCCGVNK